MDRDWTQLPGCCRLLIVQHMDSRARAAWRAVCKLSREDVHATTHTLTWRGEGDELSYTSVNMNFAPYSSYAMLSSTLMTTLTSLRHLRCARMRALTSIQGMPPTLRLLDLTDCYSLASLAPLQHCTALEQLTLRCQGGLVETLPPVMSTLSPHLRHLELRLPDSTGHAAAEAAVRSLEPLTGLRHLSLRLYSDSRTLWQALASAIGRMAGLRVLELSKDDDYRRHFHADEELQLLTPAIGQLKQLRTLNLSGNRLTAGTMRALCEAFTHLPPTLTHLDLGFTLKGEDSLCALAPTLRALAASLEVLRLPAVPTEWYRVTPISLGPEGMATIAPSLRRCSALREVDLRWCDVGAAGAVDLAAALSGCAPSLTSLDIFGNDFGDEGAVQLAPILGAMTCLAKLDYSNNGLGPAGAPALAAALSSVAPSLTFLDLSYNRLADDGTVAIAPALRSMMALADLDYSTNAVQGDGTAALAGALSAIAPSLASLNLSNNRLGPDGVVALAPALSRMTGLAALDIERASMGAVGAAALSAALAPTITCLKLSDNDIGDDGVMALAPAISRMTALTQLDLSCNKLGPVGAAALATALPQLPCLSRLDLRANCLRFEGLRALALGLQGLPERQHWEIGCSPQRVSKDAAEHVKGVQQVTSLMHELSGRVSWMTCDARDNSGIGGFKVLGVVVVICSA